MILFINTADRERANLALIGEKTFKIGIKLSRGLSEKLPLLVEKLLKRAKISLKNVKKIVVVQGPGSFAGTRTGVAYANALGFSLNVPVVGIKSHEIEEKLNEIAKLKGSKAIVQVVYSAPPNITFPKSKR